VGNAELELLATYTREKSKLTKAWIRAAIDALMSTNCPTTAGRIAACQRRSPRAAPTMPNTDCATASTRARISAK
jgi:hypothetical protein